MSVVGYLKSRVAPLALAFGFAAGQAAGGVILGELSEWDDPARWEDLCNAEELTADMIAWIESNPLYDDYVQYLLDNCPELALGLLDVVTASIDDTGPSFDLVIVHRTDSTRPLRLNWFEVEGLGVAADEGARE